MSAISDLTEGVSQMFGPLTFDSTATSVQNDEITCLLCDNTFNPNLAFTIFVKHLFEVHNLVVDEVQDIKNLAGYMDFWRLKFRDNPFEEIVPSVKVGDVKSRYFLLSPLMPEDKAIRHKLLLESTLKLQEFELHDKNYKRECLFCKLTVEGSRHDYVNHLSSQHNLQLGNPRNLVNIDELIERIAQQLVDLKCIYCNKLFPERQILKEHMRKKLHKRINPLDKSYDKYYIVNYLESDRTVNSDSDCYNGDDENRDEDYGDWNEEEDHITCLLCPVKDTNVNNLCLHMEADHEFDFADITSEFDFYQKVKLVNYIRRQMHNNRCLYCDSQFEQGEVLRRHMREREHCKVPELRVFDQPEFYFPTYENDAFLYFIDDVED